MQVNKFANYLLALIILLQLLNMIVFSYFVPKHGSKAIVPVFLVLFIVNASALFGIRKIKVYDDKNKPYENLGHILGDVIAVAVWSVIVSIVLTIVGMVYMNGKLNNTLLELFVPVLSSLTFYGALVLIIKV